VYYGYVSVDLPLLVSNLEGVEQESHLEADRQLAVDVLEHFVHLVATVSPGAKRGSTAPYSYADFVAVESGRAQPCTWANAFLDPTRTQDGMMTEAISALGKHVAAIDKVYSPGNKRRYICLHESNLLDGIAQRSDGLSELASWAASTIKGE